MRKRLFKNKRVFFNFSKPRLFTGLILYRDAFQKPNKKPVCFWQTGFKWRPLGLSSLPPANPAKPFCATSRNTAFGFALYSASFAYALSRVRSSILS